VTSFKVKVLLRHLLRMAATEAWRRCRAYSLKVGQQLLQSRFHSNPHVVQLRKPLGCRWRLLRSHRLRNSWLKALTEAPHLILRLHLNTVALSDRLIQQLAAPGNGGQVRLDSRSQEL